MKIAEITEGYKKKSARNKFDLTKTIQRLGLPDNERNIDDIIADIKNIKTTDLPDHKENTDENLRDWFGKGKTGYMSDRNCSRC